MKILGDDYSLESKNSLIYKSDYERQDINSHDAGLFPYRYSRVTVFEELDPEQRLKNDVIKKLNGGNNTKLVIRDCNKGINGTIYMKWITKMILLFNMPRFDYTDTSLLDRMIVVRHRSRFCPNNEDYKRNSHLKYTYMADNNIENKIIT